MIYLTAIGLTPGGISSVHVYTKTIQRTTQNKQYIEQHNSQIQKSADLAPSFARYTLVFALQLRKKQGKISVRACRRMPVGKECTEQSIQTIRIYKHNNKNT